MNKVSEQLTEWSQTLTDFHLPRWHELPDFDLYMDQVITLLERYIGALNQNGEDRIITSSMINNYVKQKMIPKPEKKRYNKIHIAYLIAITLLKQVLTIGEVKEGIEYQAHISGLKGAYNMLCDELEKALHTVLAQIQDGDQHNTLLEGMNIENTALKMASLSFASKLVAEQIVKFQQEAQTSTEGSHD